MQWHIMRVCDAGQLPGDAEIFSSLDDIENLSMTDGR